MTFTDKEAIELLNRVRFEELEESIEDCSEQERNGRSDLQILADKAEYILDMYSEDTAFKDDLQDARRWMRETKNGKEFNFNGFPTRSQTAMFHNRTRQARDSINSYNRLKRLVTKLRQIA